MRELMYDTNSVLITGILFLSMAVAIEVGFRIGVRTPASASESTKTHINAIQASLLGIPGLLLGFTLSLSLQRYDSRSGTVVDEANAIGTSNPRADLLVPQIRGDAKALLREYPSLRVRASSVTLVDEA